MRARSTCGGEKYRRGYRVLEKLCSLITLCGKVRFEKATFSHVSLVDYLLEIRSAIIQKYFNMNLKEIFEFRNLCTRNFCLDESTLRSSNSSQQSELVRIPKQTFGPIVSKSTYYICCEEYTYRVSLN